MELEDFLEPEIAVAAAVTAAVTSPRVRRALRRGAVFGLAGALAAGDTIASFSRGVRRGVQQTSGATGMGEERQAGQNGNGSPANSQQAEGEHSHA